MKFPQQKKMMTLELKWGKESRLFCGMTGMPVILQTIPEILSKVGTNGRVEKKKRKSRRGPPRLHFSQLMEK